MTDQEWAGFIDGLRERLTAAAGAGRTTHMEKWPLGRTGGSPASFGASGAGVDAAGGIQLAESLGWSLLDSGYLFVPEYEQSHVLTDSAHVLGGIWGIFVFRHG